MPKDIKPMVMDMSISKKILICGLPGSGKTTLAKELKSQLEKKGFTVAWYNADEVRQTFNDWDFSFEGRLRQGERMKTLAELCEVDFVICDFVAPLKLMRDKFAADYTIWMDTIDSSKYTDTNKLFEKPNKYSLRISEWNTQNTINRFLDLIHF